MHEQDRLRIEADERRLAKIKEETKVVRALHQKHRRTILTVTFLAVTFLCVLSLAKQLPFH